jgi:hypothetical protein
MTHDGSSDDDAIAALARRVAEKFAADLHIILDRVNAAHAGRPVDPVLDEIVTQLRGIGVEPDRRALRPHAVLISQRHYYVNADLDQPPES